MGAFSPASQIRVRVWSFQADERIDDAFFAARIARAIARRAQHPDLQTREALRLLHAEADGLPGVIVDRYGDWLSCQFSTAGAERHRDTIAHLLMELTGCRGVLERSEVSARKREGLPPRTGVIAGEAPPQQVQIHERGVPLVVDLYHGHKTGFYLDQADNRHLVGRLAAGLRVLNCFCYTGGFTLHAAAAGALSVLSADQSSDALKLAERNFELQASDIQAEFLQDDVFALLRRLRDSKQRFGLVVLDPPKFAERKQQVQSAARGYKDINMLACELLTPGGLLATFSCSGAVDAELFRKIVASAAVDAGRELRVIHRLAQGPDHPSLLSFPEGEYLKGLVLQAD